MTDTSIVQTEPVLVAIDISKARHEVVIAVSGKKRRRRMTVLNQLDDFNRVIATLSEHGRPVRVAFEATGNYHRAFGVRPSGWTRSRSGFDPGTGVLVLERGRAEIP